MQQNGYIPLYPSLFTRKWLYHSPMFIGAFGILFTPAIFKSYWERKPDHYSRSLQYYHGAQVSSPKPFCPPLSRGSGVSIPIFTRYTDYNQIQGGISQFNQFEIKFYYIQNLEIFKSIKLCCHQYSVLLGSFSPIIVAFGNA